MVCTRESVDDWLEYLDNFPSSADTSAKRLAGHLNAVLDDVSPYVSVGEDGRLEGGWRCSSLLEAMHVMLFLNLTSDRTIRKCESRRYPNYFRIGWQSKSKYCSKRCANRASTRLGRGQEP